MEATELIGLDVGRARTGIARASSLAKLAGPLKTVPTAEVVDELRKISHGVYVSAVVVGLPRNLQSEDSVQTKWVRSWAKSAKAKLNFDFYFQDEALTSLQARAKSFELRAESSIDEHAISAAIILQDFIDSFDSQRQRL